MASPVAAIEQAFDKLRASLSIKHRHEFSSIVLQDVWDEVQRIESVQRKRRSAQNLRRIEPFLRGLEKYSKVIEVLCNGTPYLPYAWAPIKLMLQLASSHRDIFEALLDAYAEIGNALPRFDRYESTFKDNPEFQFVLAGVYSSILEFHQRAYEFFQRGAFHLIFLSLWKDFRARFKGILHTLEKHRDFVDREAHSINLLDERTARTRILAEMENISERQRQAATILESNEKVNHVGQFQSSLSWLSANDKMQGAERFRRAAKKHAGTCKWIHDEPRLKSWLEDDILNPVVWLNGKPGAGKSIMCTAILEILDDIHSVNVCYYFCNSQDDGCDNPSERVLGIIATQLLRLHQDLASLITNEFVSRGTSSGIAQLRILVPKLLELQPYTRIVVDGIDECSKDGQKALLNELQNVCLGPNLRTKVLLSSRKEPSINAELIKKPKISLDENEKVEVDIQHYVTHKIQAVQTNFGGNLQPDVFHRIAILVAGKADGMFLWVRLITTELEQCFSQHDLEECAQRLPHGLREAYGRILDRMSDESISPHVRAQSMRILEWMSCSFRRLKIFEILDGISIRPDSLRLDNTTKLQRRVLDLCRPLVEDGPSDTLVFVHFSAQQYILEASHKQEKPFIRPEDAHLNIGFSCISYLNRALSLVPQNGKEEESMLEVVRGFHGLQGYANRYWHNHIILYMDLVVAKKLEVPEYMIGQLKEILKYRKARVVEPTAQVCANVQCTGTCSDDRFASLQRVPKLACLISSIDTFRSSLKRQDWSQKSIDDVSLHIRNSDPSWFSSIQHHYQMTLETLLDSAYSFSLLTPIVNNDLQNFRKIYSDSAFVCRYPHCNRAEHGFNTVNDREKHEAQHRREYRCDTPTCAEFQKGFATKAQLNRHKGKYHSNLSNGTSLGDEIRALKRRRLEEERQEISSYWSAPEIELFPALLRHFGTDWKAIASHMKTKTHIMVKSYYQRSSVDSGKMKELEAIARIADGKRERGETTGPLPTFRLPPTDRYDAASLPPRFLSAEGGTNIEPSKSGYTALLELPKYLFPTSPDFDNYKKAIPSVRELDVLSKELLNLKIILETRGEVCEKGISMLANMRNRSQRETLAAEPESAKQASIPTDIVPSQPQPYRAVTTGGGYDYIAPVPVTLPSMFHFRDSIKPDSSPFDTGQGLPAIDLPAIDIPAIDIPASHRNDDSNYHILPLSHAHILNRPPELLATPPENIDKSKSFAFPRDNLNSEATTELAESTANQAGLSDPQGDSMGPSIIDETPPHPSQPKRKKLSLSDYKAQREKKLSSMESSQIGEDILGRERRRWDEHFSQ